MNGSSKVVRVSQHRESSVQSLVTEGFSYRFAYARSAESQLYQEPGQDYLVFAHDQQTFVFANCDGVSLSFYGNLAAQLLGDYLVNWLWQVDSGWDTQTLGDHLNTGLQHLTQPATARVQELVLPDTLSPLVAEVLEAKRQLGSETTLVAGRMDLPGAAHPQGRVLLVWLGDTRLRLWDRSTEVTARLGPTFVTSERWSTLRGVLAPQVHMFTDTLCSEQGIKRLVTYTDGLALLDGESLGLGDRALQSLIEATWQAPTSDDISFLEIWF